MTTRQAGYLLWEYYRFRLNAYERRLLKKLLDGISGAGELNDQEIKEYLSDKQIAFIRNLSIRFRLEKRRASHV